MRVRREYFEELPEGFKQSHNYDNVYLNKEGKIIGHDVLGYYYINPYLNTFEGSREGYFKFHVPTKNKLALLHVEIARTFLGDKYKAGLVVHHKDGNTHNNNINNLEYITKSENTKKYWATMTPEERKAYSSNCSKKMKKAWQNGSYDNRPLKAVKCIETGKTYNSINEAAKDMGLSSACLSAHLKGKTKTFAKKTWEYIKKEG